MDTPRHPVQGVGAGAPSAARVTRYLIFHRHTAEECPVVFAAWKGFRSPLRHNPVHSSCRTGGHHLWWTVEAVDAPSALALLPGYVAARSEAIEVGEVRVP